MCLQPHMSAGKPATSSPDPLILDAPLIIHLPKLILWAGFQATLLYQLVEWAGGEAQLASWLWIAFSQIY